MEQRDKERFFVLLGDMILTAVCLTTLTIAAAFNVDMPVVFVAHIVSLICLILSCAFVATAGGNGGVLILSKLLLWGGLLGLAAAGVVIALRIMGY